MLLFSAPLAPAAEVPQPPIAAPRPCRSPPRVVGPRAHDADRRLPPGGIRLQAGRKEQALRGFIAIAYSGPDDERKGYVWMRVGELLLDRGEFEKALEAADKAVLLSRARYSSCRRWT